MENNQNMQKQQNTVQSTATARPVGRAPQPATARSGATAGAVKNTPASTYGRRKRPNPRLLRTLRGIMYTLMCGIAVTGLLLLILPMFRLRTVEVNGNTFYTDEQILAAAEIEVGQEMLALGSNKTIRQKIWDWDTARYIDNIAIRRTLSKIEITVTEPQNVMYTEKNGRYYVMNGDLFVLHATTDAASVADFPKIDLPAGASCKAQSYVSFSYDTPDTAYITELIDFLDQRGKWDTVTSLDVSGKYSVSYVLQNTCRVELGKVGDMETKATLIEEILSRKNADLLTPSVIDVSNVGKPTYRTLANLELSLHE